MMLCVHLQLHGHMTEMNAELLARLVVGRKRDGRCRYDPLVKQVLIDECLSRASMAAFVALQVTAHPRKPIHLELEFAKPQKSYFASTSVPSHTRPHTPSSYQPTSPCVGTRMP